MLYIIFKEDNYMSEERREHKRSGLFCYTNYIKVAKELGYSDRVIEKLMNAKSDYEKDRIMKSARQNEDYAPEKIIWNEWEEMDL